MNDESYGLLPGRYPAIVRAYDAPARLCRVEIPGLTDGGDVLPLAEIEYSIGDKSRNGANATEIEIAPGDTVWVAFIGGDARYPVITGYRNPQVGNSIDWRRWHHVNVELLADGTMRLAVGASEIVLTPGNITISSPSVMIAAGALDIQKT
jgi:hypothetical protein